ncbi:MAG: hypothetical protein WB987_06735 [Candidatus Acidiferrales bacterium]
MATEHLPKQQAPKHGADGYEHSDANVRSLFLYGLTLAILIAVVMVAMVRTYNFFARHESLGPPASPFETQRPLPPQPRLQPRPAFDLKTYCEMEQQQLSTYGWVDQHNGVVRIPVDRAMEMVLQKGLPARPADQAPAEPQVTPVGSALEPRAMGIAGPCGYLAKPAGESPESK